jgi:hypothetical protein
MDPMEASRLQGSINRRAVGARRQQLSPTDNAVLLARDRANCIGFSSDSEGNSMRFAHPAIVGARAVPAQRTLRDNSAQLLATR